MHLDTCTVHLYKVYVFSCLTCTKNSICINEEVCSLHWRAVAIRIIGIRNNQPLLQINGFSGQDPNADNFIEVDADGDIKAVDFINEIDLDKVENYVIRDPLLEIPTIRSEVTEFETLWDEDEEEEKKSNHESGFIILPSSFPFYASEMRIFSHVYLRINMLQ